MGALLVLATAMLAAPAWAAKVVEVRVGNHPTYTRVVFELDAPAGYRIERRSEGGVSEVLVTMEASSTPRSVSRKTVMVERVAVQDGRERSVAHIRLKQQPSRVKEMILANPPRLVFDLVFPESKLAAIRAREAAKAEKAKAAAAARQTAQAEAGGTAQAAEQAKAREAAKAAEQAKAREAAKAAEQAKAREAAKAAEQAKAREAAKAAEQAKAREAAKAAEQAKAAAAAKAAEEAKAREAAKAAEQAKAAAAAKAAEEAKAREAAKAAEQAKAAAAAKAAEQAKAREAAKAAAQAKAPDAAKTADTLAKTEEPVAPSDAKPEERADVPPVVDIEPERAKIVREKPVARPRPTAKPRKVEPRKAPADDSLLASLDWRIVGGAAAGVLLLAILVVLWLRRRSLPNDKDVTALAEEAGAEEGGAASADAFSWGEEVSEAGSTPYSQDAADLPAPGSRKGPDITAGPGSYDEHEKESEMDSETPSLPIDRTASEMPTAVGGAAVAGGDVGRLLGELERRVAQLETRLDESVDARERLERQVAAQAEELRVQRAAIARTQRALRSLNRGEEDQATEPALRDPSA